jgi:hypothetical protein
MRFGYRGRQVSADKRNFRKTKPNSPMFSKPPPNDGSVANGQHFESSSKGC